MADRVTISIDGGVADVRLNRPDKLNALDQQLMAGLVEAGQSLAADPSVRAIVLSGEGRAFCAGLDLGAFQQMAGRPGRRAGDDADPDDDGDAATASVDHVDQRPRHHLAQEAAGSGAARRCP